MDLPVAEVEMLHQDMIVKYDMQFSFPFQNMQKHCYILSEKQEESMILQVQDFEQWTWARMHLIVRPTPNARHNSSMFSQLYHC